MSKKNAPDTGATERAAERGSRYTERLLPRQGSWMLAENLGPAWMMGRYHNQPLPGDDDARCWSARPGNSFMWLSASLCGSGTERRRFRHYEASMTAGRRCVAKPATLAASGGKGDPTGIGSGEHLFHHLEKEAKKLWPGRVESVAGYWRQQPHPEVAPMELRLTFYRQKAKIVHA